MASHSSAGMLICLRPPSPRQLGSTGRLTELSLPGTPRPITAHLLDPSPVTFDILGVTSFSTFNIAGSGLVAASAKLLASARNIANADTPGYAPQRAKLTPAPANAGVTVSPAAQAEQGSVNLAREITELARAKTLYNANAAVVAIASDVTGTLLNILDTDRRRD